jgi:transposase
VVADKEAMMRGQFSDQGRMFSYLSPENRVPKGHPLRAVRAMVRAVLDDLHGDFAGFYSSEGRPSIPPEQLLSTQLLQVFYGIRSERQLMENRNSLKVGGTVTHATVTAEREASEELLAAKVSQTGKRATVGEDKA